MIDAEFILQIKDEYGDKLPLFFFLSDELPLAYIAPVISSNLGIETYSNTIGIYRQPDTTFISAVQDLSGTRTIVWNILTAFIRSFNDRVKYNWSDWTWFGSGNTFCDAETALLIYPRKLFIGIGDKDELFDADSGIKEFEKLTAYTKERDWVYFEHFDGGHEFFKEDPEKLL